MSRYERIVCSDVAVDSTFDDDTVEIVGRYTYMHREVAKYLCGNCSRQALVASEILDDPDRKKELAPALVRGGFCLQAVEVAPFNEGKHTPVTILAGLTVDTQIL